MDKVVTDASPDDYDGLVLPGGVANPDFPRTNKNVAQFVGAFFKQQKPVAAICHAPWTLIEADVVRGRRMTSWPSLQTDLRNAGAEWVYEEVVCPRASCHRVDGGVRCHVAGRPAVWFRMISASAMASPGAFTSASLSK